MSFSLKLVVEKIQRINELIDASLMERIASSSLDFLVTSAIATVDVSAVAVDIAPLLILCTCGFIWNFVMLGCVSRFLLPNHWYVKNTNSLKFDISELAAKNNSQYGKDLTKNMQKQYL